MRATILCSIIALTSAMTVAQKPPERGQDATPTKTANIDELKNVDREIDAAVEKGDVSRIQHLLAEEMISVMPEGTISKKTDFLQVVKPPKAGTTLTITEKDVQVFVIGETGIVTSNKTATWRRSKGSSSDDYRETNTYARKDGQWFLLASQTSHAPPPYSAKD